MDLNPPRLAGSRINQTQPEAFAPNTLGTGGRKLPPPSATLRASRDTATADGGKPAPFTNLTGLDFASFRLAILCDEMRSLSSAARRANMSLSCASHRLSSLERLAGTRLFERDYRGLKPTPVGALFVAHARAILKTLSSFQLEAKVLKQTGAGARHGDTVDAQQQG